MSALIYSINLFLISLFITGCQAIPQISSDIEKIADNDAIILKVDKDAFQARQDVSVNVEVKNK